MPFSNRDKRFCAFPVKLNFMLNETPTVAASKCLQFFTGYWNVGKVLKTATTKYLQRKEKFCNQL